MSVKALRGKRLAGIEQRFCLIIGHVWVALVAWVCDAITIRLMDRQRVQLMLLVLSCSVIRVPLAMPLA